MDVLQEPRVVTRALLLLAVLGSCSPTVVPPAPPPLRPAPEPRPIDHTDLPTLTAQHGRLPTSFVPSQVRAGLSLDPDVRAFSGLIEITGTLTEPSGVIWLNAEDLVIHSVEARPASGPSQRLVAHAPVPKLIALQSATPLQTGEWTLRIEYSGSWNHRDPVGGFVQTHGGSPYVFTQFEPDYARQVFPCIDEPDRKVPWKLTITAPEHLVVASNTPVEKRVVDHARKLQIVTFEKTPPLPSYLVAFAVGPFGRLDGGRSKNGTPIQILSLHDQPATAAHAASIAASLDAIEAWVGIPFPYSKLDVVVVPHTPNWWYAMENAGLVTIDAGALGDPAIWDHVMAHEIAHHWFGNLVTLAWWNDLWLNEAFAEWVAIVATKGYLPALQAPGVDGSMVPTVINPRYERAIPARARGPAVLSRFASAIGLSTMQSAITRYLAAHPHGTVTSEDFLSVLDATAGGGFARLLTSYLESAGGDLLTALECTKGKPPRVKVIGIQLPEEIVCVAYEREGKRVDQCRRTTATESGFDLDARACPRWFLGEDIGTADFAPLTTLAWPLLTERERFRVFERATSAGPTAAWTVLPRVLSSTDPEMIERLKSHLWESRARLDDKKLVARFDAWVLAELGEQARATKERMGLVGLAAIGALVGEPTLLAHARSLIGTKHVGEDAATVILAQLDAALAENQLENLLAGTDAPWAEFALRYSPFTFELVKKHASRVGKTPRALGLLYQLCSVPYQDLLDLAKAIVPSLDAARIVGSPVQHSGCVLQRRDTATAVRTFLDARDKKAPRKR